MATILVVDDLPANRAVLVTLLGYEGHRVLEASNGREALALAHGGRIDLVITDVLMPIMDGYELVRQLRLDPATALVPVVFYTAHYAEHEARALALSSGVAHVLTKPIEPDTVLSAIRSVLEGASRREAAAPLSADFDRDHLRLVTDKLSQTDEDLRDANGRLRALVNIGLELASERDAERLLRNVGTAAHELFRATYVTLGILDRRDDTMRHFVTSGVDFGWPRSRTWVPAPFRRAMQERQPQRGINRGGDPELLGLGPAHPPIEAYLIAPIASPAHVYGWLCLVGNEGRSFSETDEQLVIALSGQVGRIYENGYFYRLARQERDRAQRYLDTADVILLGLDLDGRLNVVNRKGCDLLERTEAELLGCDWVETCVPAAMREAQRAHFQAVIDNGPALVRSAIRTRSGRERLIEWRSTSLRDDDDRVIGTLSSGADVTEQHVAMEALRTAEERMRFALDNAGVGIWDMDCVTGTVRWSEKLEEQYGLPTGAFSGRLADVIQYVHPEDTQRLVDTMTRAMQAGADFSVQHRVVWPDGAVRWLSGAGRFHLSPQGTPLRGVGISQDVTERRTLEEQYHQAQKMEAIGRLAGGIAHDFNNLLTAILGYCELLLASRAAGEPDHHDIAQIQQAGIRASALTRQLLAFSRKQIIAPTTLDVSGVVSDLRPMLERLIGEDVKLVFVLRHDLSPVLADRGQIEQIVMNLVVNARDAMPRGGALTIETADVQLDEHYARTHVTARPGRYIALTVTDTGVGIPNDVMARIFEPFFTTKEPGKGTGLGLATVHGIVTRAGGSIGVYSEIGRGTSFKVYLPHAAPLDAAADPPPLPEPRRGGGETILLVEDADELRALTRRLLEREGYTVRVAANAAEALEQFEQTPSIDVLLTDVVMPGASGPEVMEQLAARRPSLRVIYMSGYTEDAITHHGVLKPGIDFLNKPFTADALASKIREVLDR